MRNLTIKHDLVTSYSSTSRHKEDNGVQIETIILHQNEIQNVKVITLKVSAFNYNFIHIHDIKSNTTLLLKSEKNIKTTSCCGLTQKTPYIEPTTVTFNIEQPLTIITVRGSHDRFLSHRKIFDSMINELHIYNNNYLKDKNLYINDEKSEKKLLSRNEIEIARESIKKIGSITINNKKSLFALHS